MEKNLQVNGKIVQKRHKGSTLRFQVLPIRHSSSTDGKESDSNKNKDSEGAMWLAVIIITILMTKYLILSQYILNTRQNENSSTDNKPNQSCLKDSFDSEELI